MPLFFLPANGAQRQRKYEKCVHVTHEHITIEFSVLDFVILYVFHSGTGSLQ